jgi:abhydrolase domain-containing protein 1/3
MFRSMIFPMFLCSLLYFAYFTTFAVLLLLYILYPYVIHKTRLYYKPSPFMARILRQCPSITKGYTPTFFLTNGFWHMLFEGTVGDSRYVSSLLPSIDFRTETVLMPDGGITTIDWTGNPSHKKVLIIGPGLTGDSDTPYVKETTIAALERKFQVAVLHGRGIGGNEIRVFSK